MPGQARARTKLIQAQVRSGRVRPPTAVSDGCPLAEAGEAREGGRHPTALKLDAYGRDMFGPLPLRRRVKPVRGAGAGRAAPAYFQYTPGRGPASDPDNPERRVTCRAGPRGGGNHLA